MHKPTDIDVKRKNLVYYDGSCPMCTAIINKIDDSQKSEKFSLRDIITESLPANFTKIEVEKEMHVVVAGKTYKNAEAILKILEEYPAWRFFVWFGRLPLVRSILPIGYNFIAANRHFLFGSASRLYWLKIVVSLGFIVGLLLSLKLWVSSRLYPLTPILPIFPTVSYPGDWIILLVLFGLLVTTILAAKPKPFIWAAIGVVLLLVVFDQQRLQPWVYQYTFMLAALGLFSWKWNHVEARNTTLNICRFIVASIYFWSGLQKLNIEFIGGVFPWMIDPLAQLFPSSVQIGFYTFGVFVPFIEMAIGIGLLTRKFRRVAIGLALAMCVLVLVTLGPLGHGWNTIVWPWNITLVIIVALLFIKTKNVSWSQIVWVKDSVFHKVILITFGILPLFYFFNLWDSYMSWSLYSGTTNEAVIYLTDKVESELPTPLQQLVQTDEQGRKMLSISQWSLSELNVPPYPETRIFKNVTRSICKAVDNPSEVTLVMRGRLSWSNRQSQKVFYCAQLN